MKTPCHILIFIGFLVLFLVILYFVYKNPYDFNVVDSINYKKWDFFDMNETIDYIAKSKKYNILPKLDLQQKIDIPLLYINLDRSTERREFMERQLNIFKLDYKRISAVDGKKIRNIHKDTIDDVKFINNYNDMSAYETACTLSHLKAIKHAHEKGYDTSLIVEDDTCLFLLPYWCYTLREIMNNAPNDWSIIQLFTMNEKCRTFDNKYIKHTEHKPCWSTAAYVINRKGMQEILRQTGYNPFTLGVHSENGLFPQHGSADRYIYTLTNSYYYTTPLFLVSDHILNSTIHRDHETSHQIATNNVLEKYNLYNIKPKKDLQKQLKFSEALHDMKDYLDSLHVPFHLQCGTLLGAFREGEFIGHDMDIDLGVMVEDYIPDLEKGNEKLKLERKLGDISTGAEFTFKHLETDVNIDIFLVYDTPEYFWYASFFGICDEAKNKICRWRLPKYGLTSLYFAGFYYLIPNNTEEVLSAAYGPNWNIPKKFGYYDGISNGLYRGLITSDFDDGVIEKGYNQREEESKICDIWPRKIRESAKPIIWMYWQNKNSESVKPPYLELCYKTIQNRCGDKFNIIMLNDKNIPAISRTVHPKYTNIQPLAMRADYVRFSIVAEYGGIWFDADTVVLKDISFILRDLEKYNFVAFSHDNKMDISTGIFGGNKDNRVCNYFKYLFETDSTFNNWLNEKFEISWAGPTDKAIEYMKILDKVYPFEIYTYPAKETIYPIHWKKSRQYFWNKGTLDDKILSMQMVYLHNETYTDKDKKMTEKEILNSDLRIGQLFKHALEKP